MTVAAPLMGRARLAALLAVNGISVAGTRMSALAVPWLVLVTTGSAAKTGAVAAAELAPMVIAMGLSGPMIDRLSARFVSIASDVSGAVLVALVPLLHALGALHYWLLLVIMALLGAARGPGDTAKDTLAPHLAEVTELSIERIAGLTGTTDRSASIIAPALGGVLVAAVGAANVLVVDAVSFAICALGVGLWLPRRQLQPAVADERYLVQLRGGLRYLGDDRLIRGLMAMVCATNLLDVALSTVLLPTWIRSHGYGPQQLGLIGTAFGITATAGALVAAVVGERLPRRLVFLLGFALSGPPRWLVLALGVPVWVVIGVSVCAGFGAGFLNPVLSAVFVERVPSTMLGRVNALATSLAWAGMPIGGLVAGAAVVGIGLAPALAIGAAGYALAIVLPARLREWREMDEHRTAPAVAVAQA